MRNLLSMLGSLRRRLLQPLPGVGGPSVAPGALDDRAFVRFAFELLLSRQANEPEVDNYAGMIGRQAMTRDEVLISLAHSDEFYQRHNMPYLHEFLLDRVAVGDSARFGSFVKKSPFREAQINELVNPLKWLIPEWRTIGYDLKVVPMSLQHMHRKGFEWIQTLFGLQLLGKVAAGAEVLGVGTGHEPIVYWMARHYRQVYATDLFEGPWVDGPAREGDAGVLEDPDRFKPFDYPKERLTFMRMDGRNITFPDDAFDVVFSLSSIEHFGGKDASARSMSEMGRVLKPGGVAVVATEYIMNGTKHVEFFDEDDLLDYVVRPSGLRLMQPIDFSVPRVFLERPLKFPAEIYRAPHLSLTDGNMIWTSIVLFFEKDRTAPEGTESAREGR